MYKQLHPNHKKKFIVVGRDSKRHDPRDYHWKAASEADRDYWVKGLTVYKDHAQAKKI